MSDEAEQPAEEKKDAVEAGGDEVGGGSLDVPPKVDNMKRFLAVLIDGVLAGVVMAVIGAVGGVLAGMVSGMIGGIVIGLGQAVGGGYMLIRDSLNDGRSFGKKFMGLTVKTPDGSPCTQQQSIQRNMLQGGPLVVMGGATILGSLVGILGTLLGLVGAVIGLGSLYEAVQVVALDANGRRLMESKAQVYTVPA